MRGDNVITALKRPGNEGRSHNADEKPNIMNSFFSSIGLNLAARIPQAQSIFLASCQSKSMPGPLSLNPSLLLKLKLKSCLYHLIKVYGLYSCPSRILKCASKITWSALCKRIDNSVENGAYPSKLKHAKFVPVYKGEDKPDPSNYLPISLFSIEFSKKRCIVD